MRGKWCNFIPVKSIVINKITPFFPGGKQYKFATCCPFLLLGRQNGYVSLLILSIALKKKKHNQTLIMEERKQTGKGIPALKYKI